MLVPEQQLTFVLEVSVHHINERLPHVGELEQKFFLHLAIIAIGDFVLIRAAIERVGVKLQTIRELLGEVFVDERDVVADAADFENLLAAEAQLLVPAGFRHEIVAVVVILSELAAIPAIFNLAEKLNADLIRIDPARLHRHDARMVIAEIDDLRILERLFGQNLRVPVRGPALVHDFGLPLRREIIALVADDGEHLVLPVLERRVRQAKTPEYLFAARRDSSCLFSRGPRLFSSAPRETRAD